MRDITLCQLFRGQWLTQMDGRVFTEECRKDYRVLTRVRAHFIQIGHYLTAYLIICGEVPFTRHPYTVPVFILTVSSISPTLGWSHTKDYKKGRILYSKSTEDIRVVRANFVQGKKQRVLSFS